MRHHIRAFVALLLMISLLLPVASLARPFVDPAQQQGRPARQRPALAGQRIEGTGFSPRARRTGSINVVIELADEPTTQVYARVAAGGPSLQATASAQAQLARIERAQQQLLAPLASMGAHVLYRNQRVYNGIAVKVDAGKLVDIARLPGVKAIRPLISKKLDLTSSVPLIGASEAWNGGGPTGQGIKIAIIDTGIDYIHTGFGGSGLQADYNRNNTTVITETPSLFPTAKVAGGFDFVGDDYDADSDDPQATIPHPDPDPMDCDGHGTHVAGIAAGNGVNADGTAYTGPYSSTLDFNNFRVGPGVAPQATLYALRVFGCVGTTTVVDQAIEWAVDPNGDGNFADRMDVINMSLGSTFGGNDDTTAVATNNAALAGVIVATSAGNAGDTFYVHDSPGAAERAIAVASSVDALSILDGFRVNAPPSIAGVKPALESALFDWEGSTPVTGTLVYPPSQRNGCSEFTPANKALINGKIVLLDWTENECGSIARGANVEDAGGIGFILADESEFFDLSINGSENIPSVSTPKSVGDELKTALGSGPVSVTLSHEYAHSIPETDPRAVDIVSDFSSRGVTRSGNLLKPDIAAPGQTIFSVGALTGNQGASIDGTSMASPHIAGTMALLKQLHPTWTVEELKALVMNTATHDVRQALNLNSNAPAISPSRMGAGRVDVANAAENQVIAYTTNTPGAVSVSFGAVEVLGTATATRQVRVVNKGSSAATFNVGYAPITTVPGVTYSVSPATISLAAGAQANVTVTMNATAANMRHNHDPSLLEEQAGDARHWLSEASGFVTLTPPAATRIFKADIRGSNEVPPVTDVDVTATGVFTYTDATNRLDVQVTFSEPFTITMSHIHAALSGANGSVIHGLTGAENGILQITQVVTLTAAEEAQLLSGGLYFNAHTSDHQSGAVRGQIVAAEPQLRVPVYATARPASNMHAQPATLPFNRNTITGTATVTLTGQTVNTGTNTPPFDVLAQVSALELQATSPNEASSPTRADDADLRYIGIASNVGSTNFFTETLISFGIATHGDWATPNAVEFDIYIDTNRDGTDDFVLFNASSGLGADTTDTFLTVLCNLATDDCFFEEYLNGLPANAVDTVLFNTNVMLMPVLADELGLTASNAQFNYQVVSFSVALQDDQENLPVVDVSPVLTYDAAHPGLDVSGGALSDVPLFDDLPGATIAVEYDRHAFAAARSQGLVLFHHHNRRGNRVDVLPLNVRILHLPIIGK